MNQKIINQFFNPKDNNYDFSKLNVVYLKRGSSIQATNSVTRRWLVLHLIYNLWSHWAYLANNKLNLNRPKNFEKKFTDTLKILFKSEGFLRGNVLDLGGGCGSYRSYWIPVKNKIYFNHDPNVRNFAHCFGQDQHFISVEGKAEKLPYKDEVFDIVLIADALDHFADPVKSLKEVIRVLKKGGMVEIIQCFRNFKHANTFLERLYVRLMAFLNKIAHVQNYEKQKLINLVEQLELNQIRTKLKRVKNTPIDILFVQAVKP